MNFSDITFSFEATRWIATTGIGIYAWLIGRQSASAKELLELRTRITTLEAEMRQVPSSDQLHEVAAKLARIDARMDGIAESVQPIARSLDRINDYLLQHK